MLVYTVKKCHDTYHTCFLFNLQSGKLVKKENTACD